LPDFVKIDVRNLVFPVIAGRETAEGFRRTAFRGTGFFISTRGLALTAAHVIHQNPEELRVALPATGGSSPMKAVELDWAITLPNSDIAVLRVNVQSSQCFLSRFDKVLNCEDVETTGLPESMFETEASGSTRIDMRCARGYVSHGRGNWIAASFPLPKGMSGAPLIRKRADDDFVVGVFVGQTRGEQIEDLVEEITESGPSSTRVHVERVARVEYFARGELLRPFADFSAERFGGLTLSQLIARETRPGGVARQ
jgi:hypothetical protein